MIINCKHKRMAKCNKYTLSFCNNKFMDCEDCKKCSLVKHKFEPLYKFINGVKYKRCPQCGEYYPLSELKQVNGYKTWCKQCSHKYGVEHYQSKKKLFIINNSEPMTGTEMLKWIRENLIVNNVKSVSIRKYD